MKKFYTAMNEAVFFFSIGLKDKTSKEFIKQVTKLDIYKNEIKNSKLLKDYINTREKTIDYLAWTNIGYVNIEINNVKYDWLNDRNFSYACKLLSNAVERSQNYKNTEKVIQINLCHLGKTEKGIVKYQVRSEEVAEGFEEIFTEKMEIYVVNVDFYKKMVYNGNKKFIDENYLLCAVDLRLEEIDKISEGNEILMDFKKDIEKINDDEDFVKWMSYEEEQEKIRNTLIQDGYDAGIEKGIEQGIEKGEKYKQFEIAKNMLQENIDLNTISKVTGLSLEEINELK